jgi:hypothetical protein
MISSFFLCKEKEYGLFINGKWVLIDEKIGVVNKAAGTESTFISVAGEAEGKEAVSGFVLR